jgi:hypothetical protein
VEISYRHTAVGIRQRLSRPTSNEASIALDRRHVLLGLVHRVSHEHGGHANDLGRGQAPLDVVALADLFEGTFSKARGPREECQAPGQRKGVGHARVQALTAVDRVDMGGITGKEDATLAVPRQERTGNAFLD